jgi:hypothetical protein
MSYIDTIPEGCHEFKAWANEAGIQSDDEAWQKLHRADLMLWLTKKRGIELDEAKLRHFAVDCAEDVLPLFERRYPGDDRPRKAIHAARRLADGNEDTDFDSVWHAARDAARSSSSIAAWTAARAFAWKSDRLAAFDCACVASVNAAMAAAGEAAWAVAAPSISTWYAAWDTAWDAAMKTQADRLRKYFPNPFKEKP